VLGRNVTNRHACGGSYLQIRPARMDAFRCAMASIEIIGFTPEALGNEELSITNRLRISHVWPSGLVADVLGDPPIRALPMM
jgi:hypothetical protein